jgi:hypothetical protein
MSLLQPFKEMKLINRHLSVSTIALFMFFTSEFLVYESYTIHTIISGNFGINSFLEIFDYRNFVSIISFVILYLVIRNYSNVSNVEKESYLISLIIIVFVFNYIFKFYFMERIFSLTATGLNSLPNSITDFFPFDWYYLSTGYTDFQSDYDPGWYKIRFIFVLISALSISISIFFAWKYLHTSKVKPEIKKNLFQLKTLFKPTKTRVVGLSIVMTFSLFGIQNIKANDYRSISYEAEFMQDDLVKFQEELKVANQISFQSDKYEARKIAANKSYSDISRRNERLNDFRLSLWSSNLNDLKSGIIEWMVLWEKFLKEMSLQGYVEAGTLFDLNQKYAEVVKLGKSHAPELVDEYSIDYWDEEFYPLVN